MDVVTTNFIEKAEVFAGDVRFTRRMLLLLMIIAFLIYQGEGKDAGSSDRTHGKRQSEGSQVERKRILRPIPLIIGIVKNEPIDSSTFSKAFYFWKVSSADAHLQTFDKAKMGLSRGRKLRAEKRHTWHYKRHDETAMFEPGQKDDDNAGSAALSADYWPPRHHPPKNN